MGQKEPRPPSREKKGLRLTNLRGKKDRDMGGRGLERSLSKGATKIGGRALIKKVLRWHTEGRGIYMPPLMEKDAEVE